MNKAPSVEKVQKKEHNVLIRTHIFSQKQGHDTTEKAVEEAEGTICGFASKVSMYSMCVGENAAKMPTCM